MSKVDKLANQPISDALIDELTDLLYEATIRSSTPRKDIKRIVGDFLEAYVDADTVLCSVCTFFGMIMNQEYILSTQHSLHPAQLVLRSAPECSQHLPSSYCP